MVRLFFVTLIFLPISLWGGEGSSLDKRFLIIGDSLTEGYGVSQSAAYPNQLEKIFLENKLPFKVFNAGSSGSTSASLKKRLLWHIKNKPKYLMIALGANDGLRGIPVKQTYNNLKQAIEFSKDKNINIILAGMKMPINYGKKYRNEFEETYSRLSKEHPEVIFIPFLLKGVGGVKELNLSDGIHPNEKGHKKIAEHVYQSIKEKLK